MRFGLLLLLVLSGYAAQDFRSDSMLVLLDVSVKNPSGGYVSGLNQSSFQVYENGVLQKITQFAAADVPVAAGLVIDHSGSMQPRRNSVIEAGIAFVEASNQQDQIFVVNFNDTVWSGLPDSIPFSDNTEVLRAALAKGRSVGQTALYDAIAYALRHLETSRRDKKTLIVISDGGDNISTLKLPEVMRLIETSGATVYTVGLVDTNDPARRPGVLKQMANVSGGECYLPAEEEPVLPICRRIAKEIRNRYTVGFVPQRTNDKGSERKIRVTATSADGAKLVVRTRTAYRLPGLSK